MTTQFSTEVVSVDPSFARECLEHNIANRPLKRGRIKTYARLMSEGKWVLTHQGIAFDTDGTLIDGQNRCHAVIESGATVQMLVTRGVVPSAFTSIDTQAVRNNSDALALAGFVNSVGVGAAARVIATYDLARENKIALTSASRRLAETWNNDEALRWANAWPDLENKVSESRRIAQVLGVRSYAALSAVTCLTSHLDAEKSASFVEGILSGADLSAGDPRLAIRNMKTWGTHTGHGLVLYTLQVVGRAWESFSQDRPLRRFHITPDYVPNLGDAS